MVVPCVRPEGRYRRARCARAASGASGAGSTRPAAGAGWPGFPRWMGQGVPGPPGLPWTHGFPGIALFPPAGGRAPAGRGRGPPGRRRAAASGGDGGRGGRTRAITVFPSTTSVAYLPFLTGCTPGHCNIPSIRWLDRRGLRRPLVARARGGAELLRLPGAPARRRHRARRAHHLRAGAREHRHLHAGRARAHAGARSLAAGAPVLGRAGALRPVAPAVGRRGRPAPAARGGRAGALRVRPVPGGGRVHPPDRSGRRAGAAGASEGGRGGGAGARAAARRGASWSRR